MAEAYTTEALLTIAREGLRDIGYQDNLLQEKYSFADFFAQDEPLRHIALGAFGQEPPNYRTACFGIATPPHDGPEAIMDYRALGAPQIIALHPEKIYRWEIIAQGYPELVERIEPAHLRNAILTHRSTWNPEQVLRAKSIGFTSEPVQLDFFDIGLIPALESIVQKKLDKLLRDVLALCEAIYKEHHEDELDNKALFRLIFRLIAAKLLGDRQYPGEWLSSNTQQVIADVESFYFQDTSHEAVLDDVDVQNRAWQKIRTAFSFQNLSVETLAYIYENTFVSPEIRKEYGTHATPPEIAEYIVQRLPFKELARDERYVFEPFCGHAPFLTAALGRLRALLPPEMNAKQRHEYFVRMLSGMELDSFACEVARNRLILTDDPNPNGWRIVNSNFFSSPELKKYLTEAQIILCNPPYEDFTFENRRFISPVHSVNKAIEALYLVLQRSPKMLGFVLPRGLIDGQGFREARQKIISQYDDISLIELPDNVFNYSEAKTVLLIAHGRRTHEQVLRYAFVEKKDYERFLYTGVATSNVVVPPGYVQVKKDVSFRYGTLQGVWDSLIELPRLGDRIEIHRGIEYNIPFQENKSSLISDVPRTGFDKGMWRVTDDFEPYTIQDFCYLNTDPNLMRGGAYKYPWWEPKVIANAARISRGSWTISATIDEQGLLCYQNFHGIWPDKSLPLEVVAALLNNPIANAFLSTQQMAWHNQIRVIEQIPIPRLRLSQIHLIVSLVQEYSSLRAQWLTQPDRIEYFERACRGIMRQIDAELLTSYDLAPHLEQELIRYFNGFKRPGPVSLTELKSSPTKKLYTSIIRIEDIRNEDGNGVIDAVIINWNPHQVVRIPMSLLPAALQEKINQDTRLLAKVNVGASKAEDLIFKDFKLAPEPKLYDAPA